MKRKYPTQPKKWTNQHQYVARWFGEREDTGKGIMPPVYTGKVMVRREGKLIKVWR